VPPPLTRPRPTAPGARLTRSCGGTLDFESAARNLRVSQPPAVSPTPSCAATLPKFTHNSVKGTRRLESRSPLSLSARPPPDAPRPWP
jgi:hypothetical protein